MNKSTLFLFSLFSTINFSYYAMKIIERGAYQLSHATTTFFNRISQQEPTFKTFEQQYRKNVEDFNTNADDLKKNVADISIRLKIHDNLKNIEAGVIFVKNVIKHDNKTINQASIRINALKIAIDEFDNINTPMDRDRVEELQRVLTKIANITIDENNNTNMYDSGILCENNTITKADIKVFNNPGLLELYKSIKQEVNVKKEHKNSQSYSDLVEKQLKNNQLRTKIHDEEMAQLQQEQQIKVIQKQIKAIPEQVKVLQELVKVEQERLKEENEELEKFVEQKNTKEEERLLKQLKLDLTNSTNKLKDYEKTQRELRSQIIDLASQIKTLTSEKNQLADDKQTLVNTISRDTK